MGGEAGEGETVGGAGVWDGRTVVGVERGVRVKLGVRLTVGRISPLELDSTFERSSRIGVGVGGSSSRMAESI